MGVSGVVGAVVALAAATMGDGRILEDLRLPGVPAGAD